MSYRQLTSKERYVIQCCRESGESKSEIANKLGRHRSTIGRELKRSSSGDVNYQAAQAQQEAAERAQNSGAAHKKVTPDLWAHVKRRIRHYWSPQQIEAELDGSDRPGLSHEWIYQLIYCDQTSGGDLWEYLRHPRKRRKHRKTAADGRGKIPNRTPIDQRPAIVDGKKRFGDWEIDLVEGAKGSGYLLTLIERTTAFALIGGLQRATASQVAELTKQLLAPFRSYVHTITCDNGKEFAGHETIAEKLSCQVYFCDPHSPWQRGLNENTNGLLRQFFPKGCDMNRFCGKHLTAAMYLLNNRPRKTLDFQTPQLLFSQYFP